MTAKKKKCMQVARKICSTNHLATYPSNVSSIMASTSSPSTEHKSDLPRSKSKLDKKEKAKDLALHQKVHLLLLEKPIVDWSVDDTCLWLSYTNNRHFSQFVSTFRQHGISGRQLISLTDTKLLSKYVHTPSQVTSLASVISSLKQKSSRRLAGLTQTSTSSPSSPDASSSSFKSSVHDAPRMYSQSLGIKSTSSKPALIGTIADSRQRSATSDVFRDLAQKLNITHGFDSEGNIIVITDDLASRSTKQVWNIYKAPVIAAINDELVEAKKPKQNGARVPKVQTTQKPHASLQTSHSTYKMQKMLQKRMESSIIVCQGWLWKRGYYNKKFQRRWFMLLKYGLILYFAQRPIKTSDVPNGVIHLSDIEKVVPNMIELDESASDASDEQNEQNEPIATKEANDGAESKMSEVGDESNKSTGATGNDVESGNIVKSVKSVENVKNGQKSSSRHVRRSSSKEDLSTKYCNQFILKTKNRDWVLAAPNVGQYFQWISEVRYVKKTTGKSEKSAGK